MTDKKDTIQTQFSKGRDVGALSIAEEKQRSEFLGWRREVMKERIVRERMPEDTQLEYVDAIVETFSAQEWREFVREGGNIPALSDPDVAAKIEQKIEDMRAKRASYSDDGWERDKFEDARVVAADEYSLRQISLKHWREMPVIEALIRRVFGQGDMPDEKVGDLFVDPHIKALFENAKGETSPFLKMKILAAYRSDPEGMEDTLKWARQNECLNDIEVARIRNVKIEAREVLASLVSGAHNAKPSSPQPD